MDYHFNTIEEKWQNWWEENNTYKVDNNSDKPKYYVLDMFPYPSGKGLHVGHPLGYIASDIYSRYKSQKGFNVLHPMGFDAFGLPAEQYAIEKNMHPADTTEENIATFKKQLRCIGFNYDWSREVRTSDPEYYKWTQWIFLQLFNSWYNQKTEKAEKIDSLITHFETNGTADLQAAGTDEKLSFTAADWASFSEKERQKALMNFRLMFQAYADIWYCPALGTVLANDEVKEGVSERGGHPVEKRKLRQWFLRTTAYAERLLADLDTLEWSDAMKEMQRNWIGKSYGASVWFDITDTGKKFEVFTTRPDTIFGVTFMVLAPEHELVAQITTDAQKSGVEQYLKYVNSRSERERMSEVKKVTGAFTGAYATHPFTGEKVPIWISEYVLAGYGTGAIMAVPSDDDRDNAFAEHFSIPIIDIIDKSNYPGSTRADKEGIMINSDFLNGMEVPDAIQLTIKKLEEKSIGQGKIQYRLRDAGFSRQRYWGEPFPVVYNEDNEQALPYALSENDLPLNLPEVESFKPTGDGKSPLANARNWVETNNQFRETDTMPGYAGSSWYFLRYMDPNNSDFFVGKEAEAYWQNVDLYIGGTEHAVGHLLYSRTWHKFFYDMGWVSTPEPFKKLVNQGMIQGISTKIERVMKSDLYCEDGGLVTCIPYRNSKGEIETINLEGEYVVNIDKFYCKSTENFGNATLGYINVNIDLVEDYNTKYPHLSKKGIGELTKQNANFSNSIFVCNKGYYKPDGTFSQFPATHLYYCYQNDFLGEIEIDKITGKEVLSVEYFAGQDMSNDFEIYLTKEIEKMSKSKYNTQDPVEVVERYGADTFRMFEMFLGPFEQGKPWDVNSIGGVYKFTRKFWQLFHQGGAFNVSDVAPTEAELKSLHKAIKKVNEDIERFSFNTCVSTFMIATNELTQAKCNKRSVLEPLVQLIAPFAPYISEEIWHLLGNESSVHHSNYPQHNEQYLTESSHEYPVMINGKMRGKIQLSLDATEEEAKAAALTNEKVQQHTEGKTIKRFILVKGKIINLVVG